MTEDVDLQPGRIRETPREPLYKRRNAGMEPLEDDGLFRRPACDESVYMLRSTLHWKRLVNGWAGGEPERHKTARARARRFPSDESVQFFRGLGVRYVVVHGGCLGPNQRARMERAIPSFEPSLREVGRFGDDWVLELAPPAGAD